MPETYRKVEGINSFNDETLSLQIDEALRVDIVDYCRQQGINLALFFKGVYGVLVQHYCRAESDFSIAEFNSNRRASENSLSRSSALGCFYQQVPMVFPISLFSKEGTFENLFSYEKNFRSRSQNSRAISLSKQAALLPSAPTVFMYNYYNFVLNRNIQGEALNPVMSAPKVESGVQMIVGELVDKIELTLRYDLDCFVDLSMLDRMVSIARQVVSGTAKRISELSYATEKESEFLQLVGPVTDSVSGQMKCANIVEWFETQVKQSSKDVAVIFGDARLTYAELNQKANQLAHYLSENGVGRNVRVGICLERSIDLVVSILAVLKAGGAYVPMDASYPKERLAFMATDCNAPFVITHSTLSDRLWC